MRRRWALAEWLGLGALGLGLALLVNGWFALAALALWVMGVLYNVKPIRTKELPYLDVLSESINNPIRLFLGWFPLIPDRVPPLSLVLSYWMVGRLLHGAEALRRVPRRSATAPPRSATGAPSGTTTRSGCW